MKKSVLFSIAAGIACFLICSCQTNPKRVLIRDRSISIVLSEKASELEIFAADELKRYLSIIYPNRQFPRVSALPDKQPAILLGTLKSFPELKEFIQENDLKKPDSFVVTRTKPKGEFLGIVAGADPRGTLYGVYALLEELGFGFYLSYETKPEPRMDAFDLTPWDLKDEPVVSERFALNWHNFLSGCSAWNLEDWQKWISQLSKMRFNAIMVHAYGNNPMESFSFNGETKPVGTLTTSQTGREWGTEHVNDVRRLFGGKEIFQGPVFGSSAALVPGSQRITAATDLMQKTFTFAEKRGMQVHFALDIDTLSSNPQNVINTIPSSARLTVQGSQLANPDTPEGYAYYEARIRSLLATYPQIDQIALWFRRGTDASLGSVWRTIQVKDFPAVWKDEYQKILNGHAEIANDPESPSLFAMAKIAQATRKALDAMNRKDVSLSAGSWGFDFLLAASVFFPQDVTLIPLDSDANIAAPEILQKVAAVSQRHPVSPIVWAHHDDRAYMGRPFIPFTNYGTCLTKNRFTRLGILHWTTRPLDLYFKNLSKQVWKRTLDEYLRQTCMDMAQRTFGPQYRQSLGDYLDQWMRNAPQFGRETTDALIDRPLPNPEMVIDGCKKRLALLASIDARSMMPDNRKWFLYYKWLEDFTLQFYQNQSALDRGKEHLRKMRIFQANTILEELSPEKTLKTYAQLCQFGDGITPGEKGLLVSLNLRWYPYFMGYRQSLREEAIRINYQPVDIDSLAQAPGKNTFFIDGEGKWWLGQGREETGLETFKIETPVSAASPWMQEIGQTGILARQKTRLHLLPFAQSRMPSGSYQVHLFLVEPAYSKIGERVFNVAMWEDSKENFKSVPLVKEKIDIVQRAGQPNHVIQLVYPIDLQHDALVIELDPVRDAAILCGVMLEPMELKERRF